MATLKDIAERAGITVPAVSQILNASDNRYAHATRKRVEQIARELKYVPNRAAQTLRTKQSRTIGVIEFAGLQQLAGVRLYHVTQAIQRCGHRPLVYDISWCGASGREICEIMIESHVRGIVLANPPIPFSRQGLPELRKAGIPTVSVGGSCLQGVPKFLTDKEDGFYQLTRHLLRLGYRRLVLSTGYSSAKRDRRHEWHAVGACNGFNRAAGEWRRQHGQVETHIELTNDSADDEDRSMAGNGSHARGYQAMQTILDRWSDTEAVLCSNDSWALGAMTACRENGIAVPEQIAITGFNDEPIARYGLLPLTTIEHPTRHTSHQAVDRLFELLEAGMTEGPDERVVVPGRLVVRSSCGANIVEGRAARA